MVYDDLSIDKVKALQTIMELQLELMVMSVPHCPEVGFAPHQEIFETCKAPHHSLLCIQDQYNIHIALPPLDLHDPIAHALEESYTACTLAQCKRSTFLTFT